MGDARRGRRRPRRAVGARGGGARRRGADRAAARGRPAAARQRAGRARRARCSCSTTCTGVERTWRPSAGSSSRCRPTCGSWSPRARTRRCPLGKLRARGQLLELRADELRFTTAEATEFLNDRLRVGLDAADIELLVARTEGWPAGMYLAALSLAAADDKHALVAAFDGTSAHVVDFLAAEVLAVHPPELQRFMLRTAVLERLCAPLCDAVLDEPGASAKLDELARTNLFLLPLDDRRRWFRFHHLFAQILRVELEKREPELAAELHRRAFAWHGSTAPPTRRSITRSRRKRVPGGVAADHRDVGALRQRRPDRVRQRVARPRPRRRRPAAAARQGVGVGAARARARHAHRRGQGARARPPRRRPAAGRVRLGRVEPGRARGDLRLGRRARRSSRTASARSGSSRPTRRGGP